MATRKRQLDGPCATCGGPPFTEEELLMSRGEIQLICDFYSDRDPLRFSDHRPCYFFDMARSTCLLHEQERPKLCRRMLAGQISLAEFMAQAVDGLAAIAWDDQERSRKK